MSDIDTRHRAVKDVVRDKVGRSVAPLSHPEVTRGVVKDLSRFVDQVVGGYLHRLSETPAEVLVIRHPLVNSRGGWHLRQPGDAGDRFTVLDAGDNLVFHVLAVFGHSLSLLTLLPPVGRACQPRRAAPV